MPLASDASGNGTQDYHQVAGRATAVVVDPADSSGNTVFVGGAQAGIWKSTNAAASSADTVTWSPISDDQATLSIGAIAIQPGNKNPANTVILAATGEANNSADSYFGLGILRSANGGSSWSLVSSANNGALSFGGLGGTRMAFSGAPNQTNTVISAMATSSRGVIEGEVFVSFSQHPSDSNTLLGGTQDNGTPATSQATTNSGWGNILGGDGGYTALDLITTSNFYASNPDVPPGGLGIQLCTGGVGCNNSTFNFVVTSNDLDGDDGAFYFPYILDPGSNTAMLVGTCRIWRRGIWQFNLLTTPDFQLSISNSRQTISVGQTAIFNGSATALNGYASSVALSCTSGITPAPATCTPSRSTLTPGRNTPFTVAASGTTRDYYLNVQGVGSDAKHVTHQAGAVLHV